MQETNQSNPFLLSSEDKIRKGNSYGPPPEDLRGGVSPAYTSFEPFDQPMLETLERPNNFPPCKPMFHHNIKNDIPPEKRGFVRKAYVGWYIHASAICVNFLALSGGLIRLGELVGFFIAAGIVIFGLPISFWVYYRLYTALRKSSAFNFVLWFVLFFFQIGAAIFFGLGVSGYGGAGFFSMLNAFEKDMVLGFFYCIATILWIASSVYGVYTFNLGRMEYSSLGGNKAASKEFGKNASQMAYENRDTIKQVAYENKDTIRDFAYENKDTIIEVAKENKGFIADVMFTPDNRDTNVKRVNMDNNDSVWENEDVVSQVFDSPSSKQ